MDSSTWTAVVIGGGFTALTLVIFAGSLVPPATRRRLRVAVATELASWPEQWRDLRGDAVALLRRGRHAGTPSADLLPDDEPDPAPEPEPAPVEPIVPVLVDADSSLGRAMLALQVAEDDRAEDVQVIRDDSVTEVLPVVPPRTEEGATEAWSPIAELESAPAPKPVVRVVHSEPDSVERDLLRRFDAIVDGLRDVPDDMVEFAATVDASLTAAGMDTEQHHRWRETAFVVDTGEWNRVLSAVS